MSSVGAFRASRTMRLRNPFGQFPSPGPQSSAPCRLVARILLDNPPPDLRGFDWEEPAHFDRHITPVSLELLDGDVFSIEPPDLVDLKRGVDAGSINFWWRNIDLDPKVGVGIIGDVP